MERDPGAGVSGDEERTERILSTAGGAKTSVVLVPAVPVPTNPTGVWRWTAVSAATTVHGYPSTTSALPASADGEVLIALASGSRLNVTRLSRRYRPPNRSSNCATTRPLYDRRALAPCIGTPGTVNERRVLMQRLIHEPEQTSSAAPDPGCQASPPRRPEHLRAHDWTASRNRNAVDCPRRQRTTRLVQPRLPRSTPTRGLRPWTGPASERPAEANEELGRDARLPPNHQTWAGNLPRRAARAERWRSFRPRSIRRLFRRIEEPRRGKRGDDWTRLRRVDEHASRAVTKHETA